MEKDLMIIISLEDHKIIEPWKRVLASNLHAQLEIGNVTNGKIRKLHTIIESI
jgi:hypothetical protein